MKHLLTTLLLASSPFAQGISAQGIADPGPHPVGWQDVTFPDPLGGTLEARLFYPASSAGEGTAPDPGAGPFPLVALLHRYIGSASNYDELSTQIASWGFFLASIDTQTGGNATMPKEAQHAADMLNWVAAESADPGSAYADMVAPGPWGAIGHSMGGGALFYLIEDEPNVQVLVGMQPYRGNALGGFANSVANLEAFAGSLFLIGGSVDNVAPAATHSYAYFETAGAAARNLHTTVEGLGHQGPTDEPPMNEPLSAAKQSELHRRFCTAFLRAELLGEDALYVELLGEGVAAEALETESRTTDSVLWATPSTVLAASMLTGIAAAGSDVAVRVVSLATASIPTQYGIFGLDLTAGLILTTTILPVGGFDEIATPIPPALTGLTLYFQGFTSGVENATLTAVQAVVVP